jgi:CDGSH-type Zn-finger protein
MRRPRLAHTDGDLTICPRGPMLVRGATQILDTAGVRHEVTRPVVAVCRCGSTGVWPWCDASHKLLGTHGRSDWEVCAMESTRADAKDGGGLG